MFYTDRGTQLCKAAQFINSQEDPSHWGWGKVQEALAVKRSKVKFCLPGCQWQNGNAEQCVYCLKDTLELTMSNGSGYLDFTEFRTLLVKCADLMNSRPLGVMLGEDDLQPLTPNHLLIGWAQLGQVSKNSLIDGADMYSKRAQYVSELCSQCWDT